MRAQAAPAPADFLTARRLLDQADRHIASAAIAGVDSDSCFAMLYDAARKAADATLRAAGRRVTQGAGHHIAFLEEAKRLLPDKHSRLMTRIDAARSVRNDMEYRGHEVTSAQLQDLTDAAPRLVAAARAYVEAAWADTDSDDAGPSGS
jgi:hypothetical protein